MHKRFLPDNSRPSYTGQGLTPTQFRFLSKPRKMDEITHILFHGDQWAANAFQNKFLHNSVLQIDEKAMISVIDWTKEDRLS